MRKSILLAAVASSAVIAGNAHAQSAGNERDTSVSEATEASSRSAGPAADSDANGEEIVITGTRAQGYIVPQTDALGLPIETAKLPASVTILSDDLLEDIGARSLGTVLPYVAGVSNGDNGGASVDNFIIRGFPNDDRYLNGIRQNLYTEGRRAIDTIEQVQILKGPAGAEGSITAPGGYVNIVTKKPLDTFRGALFGSVGTYNFYRFGGDVTGPITSGISGRLIAAYEDKQFWRRGRKKRPILTIAPSLKWDLGDRTSFLAQYEYSYQNDPLDRGIIYLQGAGLENGFLPRDFSFHGNDDFLKAKSHTVDLDLTHSFNDVLSARLHYQRLSQTQNEGAFRNGATEGRFPILFKPDRLTFSGNPITQIWYATGKTRMTAETYWGAITADLNVGATNHVFNLGGSLSSNDNIFFEAYEPYIDYSNPFNIFDPDNDQDPIPGPALAIGDFTEGDEIKSGFGQWLANWTPRFRTIASLRYDDYAFSVRESFENATQEVLDLYLPTYGVPYDPANLYRDEYQQKIWSYRLATSFDLTEDGTLFAGYAKSGQPQNAFTRSGDGVPAIASKSFEAGVKWKVAGGDALVTATAYEIERSNIAIADPTNTPFEKFRAPLGGARIRGIELELVGKVTPSLSVFSGLSLQRSKITNSDQPIVGNKFSNVPKFQASTFVNWNGRGLGLSGLDLGLGVLHQGERQANSANQYQLPAYTRVDLAVGYTFPNALEARLNVGNLFDETYYTAAQDSIIGSDQIAVGDRRLVQLTLTKRF